MDLLSRRERGFEIVRLCLHPSKSPLPGRERVRVWVELWNEQDFALTQTLSRRERGFEIVT